MKMELEMIEVYTRYILNESQHPIAVQIPIDQFQRIAEILEASGQFLFMREVEDQADLTEEDKAWLQPDTSSLGSHETYDWQPGEIEEGLPIEYMPGKGLVINS
jgi:hypothetical protein